VNPRKALYWSAFLSAGPITGPLLEGVWRNWRKGERILAGLYAVAALSTTVALPALLLALLEQFQRMGA
jgi:hypothetical protein